MISVATCPFKWQFAFLDEALLICLICQQLNSKIQLFSTQKHGQIEIFPLTDNFWAVLLCETVVAVVVLVCL